MLKKIAFILTISLIMAGVVFAADVESFKVPGDFEDLGDGVYATEDHQEILSIVEYTEHDWKDYTTNDTNNNYTVFGDENNTYNYTDGSKDEKGSFELIEVDGTKYVIDFTVIGIEDNTDFAETFNHLLDFNNINNVTAIAQ